MKKYQIQDLFKIILSIFCVLYFSYVRSQNIDSLKTELNKATHDTSKCYLLSVLAENAADGEWETFNDQLKITAERNLQKKQSQYLTKLFKKYYSSAINNIGYIYSLKGDSANALKYYYQSLKLDEEIGDSVGIANAYVNIGYVYTAKGEIEKSLVYFFKGLKIQENFGDKEGQGITLNNIGSVYDNRGDIPMALDFFHRSLKIREQLRDKDGIANSYNNIGRLTEGQGDIEKALSYYQKSLSIRKEIGDKPGIAIMINNIGDIYETKGDTAKALEFYKKSLTLSEEVGYKVGVAGALNNIGYVLEKQKQYTSALYYIQKGITIGEEISNSAGLASSYCNVGGIYYTLNKIKEAELFGEKSLNLSQQIGYPNQIKASAKLLCNVYRKQKRYDEAFKMNDLFEQMRDSVNNIQNKKSSLQKQFQYEYEKKAAADSVKVMEEKKLVAIQLDHEKKQRFWLYLGLCVVVVFAGFIYNRFKITQKQKHLIEIKESETQYQKQLVEQKQKEIVDSITYAKRLQYAILPSQEYINEHLPQNFVLYKPKDIVAGDFYWMEVIEDFMFIAAADSTGHGVPGAMVSVVCSNALNRSIKEFGLRKTGEILDKTRELVLETFAKSDSEIKDGMDISLLSVNKLKQTIMWSGANNSLCYKSLSISNDLLEIKADKQSIGKTDNYLPFMTHNIPYDAKLIFYLFTDGFADQFGGPKGKKVMHKNFKQILNQLSDLSMPSQKEYLENFFEEWRGSLEQIDDISIVGIKL